MPFKKQSARLLYRASVFYPILAATGAILATIVILPVDSKEIQEPPAGQPSTQPAPESVLALGNSDAIVGGLRGSKHDFSGSNPEGELCRSCHNPHLPNAPSPLLDHRPTSTQPLRPYQAIGVDLNSASLKCVSCHDGVIAPDVFNGAHGVRT